MFLAMTLPIISGKISGSANRRPSMFVDHTRRRKLEDSLKSKNTHLLVLVSQVTFGGRAEIDGLR
jgi:hypothetical protein